MTPQFLRHEAARFRDMAEAADREATRQRLLAMAADYEARAGAAPAPADPEPADPEAAAPELAETTRVAAEPSVEEVPKVRPARRIARQSKESIVVERRPVVRRG
jgi:hypothetical protein